MSLADTNFVSRSETCFSGAGAKIRKRQKKDILKNPFKTIKDGQDDISDEELDKSSSRTLTRQKKRLINERTSGLWLRMKG